MSKFNRNQSKDNELLNFAGKRSSQTQTIQVIHDLVAQSDHLFLYHLYTNRQHSSSDDENDSDTSIDAKLKQSAKRNNLTPQNVKNILQASVTNCAIETVSFQFNNKMCSVCFMHSHRKWYEMIMCWQLYV